MTKPVDQLTNVRKVIITTAPELHPFSNDPNSDQNYYCLAYDLKGFQYQIDLQARPAGVSLDQIEPNQVWWVEKRTTLYRLYLYAGQYDPTTRRIDSRPTLPVTSSTDTTPIGVMHDFAGSVPPSGYLLCDGSSYSITTYSGLFNVIGYAFGGSGANFNVPDMRGRVTVGAGSGTGLTNRNVGSTGGEENHVLTSGETPLAAHSHTFTVPSSNGTTGTGSTSSLSLSTSAGYSTGTGNTGTSTTTAAGTTSTESQTHAHGPNSGSSFLANDSTGNYYVGTAVPTGGVRVSISSNSTTGTENANHTHSWGSTNNVSIPALSIPALSIPTMAVTGSVSIPGLSFTVPAQTGLSTSNNTATTATGHNNMQPFAVVTKIIKY